MTTELVRPNHHHHAARRTIVRWTKRIGLAAVAAGVLGAIVRAWLPKPIAVDVGVAMRGRLDVEVDEDGQTRVQKRYVVAAPIAGNLQRVALGAGDVVAAGQPIAHIQPPDPMLLDRRARDEATARLAAAIAQQRRAQTTVERATVARDAAIRDADRMRLLDQRAAVTKTDREHAELAEQLAIRDLAAATSERAAAIAEVSAARAALGEGTAEITHELTVVAPASGRILRVVRDSAGPIAAGAPLVELGDPRALEVAIDVLSSDAARIAPGMDVALEDWGGDAALAAHVRVVEPSAFTKVSALGVEEQRVKVIASLDDPPPGLADGFRVEARIYTWRGERVLTVPASAVFRDRGAWAVYIADGDRARLAPVTLGHRGRVDVEIVAGLTEGAIVILHPGDRIADGVAIARR
jgi:HlyD family secretion protein